MKRNYFNAEAVTPGIAEGSICYFSGYDGLKIKQASTEEGKISDEVGRFKKTLSSAIEELEKTIAVLEKEGFSEQAEIVQTHILMLKDRVFQERVIDRITNRHMTVESAIEHVLKGIMSVLSETGSGIFSQRAADLKDIEVRLKRHLSAEMETALRACMAGVKTPIIATRELLPSLVLEAKERGIAAFIIEQGTSFSHAAILAKSFGIPVIRVESISRMGIKDASGVIVDAENGRLIANPGALELQKIRKPDVAETEIIDTASLPVKLWINIADPSQATPEILNNVEGIGLYRTEFLFMTRDDFPSEEEQFEIYSSLFRRCADCPVTIRTLDVGGDKTLPYFSFGRQENPNLGFRAHRIYHYHPEIIKNQLRAILRAGTLLNDLRIMYPMIESVDDLLFVQNLFSEVMASLKREHVEFKQDFKQGVLIEVPSAAWGAEYLFELVDFASVGTNDLLHYSFAVDRNNANIYSIVLPENPFFIRMLKHLVAISKKSGKELNICGEIAADLNFLPVLIGLGFTSISLDPHSLTPVKKTLSTLDVSTCKKAADKCLKAKTTSDVIEILKSTPGLSYESRKKMNPGHIGEAIDPVCKMFVDKGSTPFMAEYDDGKYYFCSKQCKDSFLRDIQTNKSIIT